MCSKNESSVELFRSCELLSPDIESTELYELTPGCTPNKFYLLKFSTGLAKPTNHRPFFGTFNNNSGVCIDKITFFY